MKTAVIGSRNLKVDLNDYLFAAEIDELVTDGMRGIGRCVRQYAKEHRIPLREALPDDSRHGRGALLRRIAGIIDYADVIVIFWDGNMNRIRFILDAFGKQRKKVIIYPMIR